MDKVRFRATTMNVRADGKRCIVGGEPHTISRETANELVAAGRGEIVDLDDRNADPGERAATIAKAVEGLSSDDWTQDGTPKVAAVVKASGLDDVRADELAGFKKPEAS